MVDEGRDDRVTAAAAAIVWHLRLPTAGAEDWQAFTAWLEADPAHGIAYDALTRADAELGDALAPADWTDAAPATAAANDDAPPARRRWALGALGGLAAAGLVAALVPFEGAPVGTTRIVETADGVRRAVSLADGSRIELNGGTRIAIADGATRTVTLERGEATFRVTHDAAHPFVVRSGDARLEDVGTVFNVTRVGSQFGVQVAEGAVLFQPDRDRIMLTAGAALAQADGGAPRMSGVAVADVGSWREGRLVFQQTPVRLVAAALARSTGAAIAVAPALAETPFTGSIGLAGKADRLVPRAAALIGAEAPRADGRWTLVPGDHAAP